jgi:N-acetylmuramoyl-L-alanine amidase
MFKLALDAGHGIGTAGKRCMKSLDPNETPEWWLNDRVCDYIAEYLRAYDGYELLRLDDFDDGKTDVGLAARTNKANAWGADFYLSIHHNAGVKGGKGGGIEAYSYSSSAGTGMIWRNDFYEALIAETGLKGNRSEPKKAANFHVLRESKMPAALLELGLIAGDESDWGLMVTTVNGITADWDTEQAYWAFYINGEYAQTGVDSTDVVADAVYEMVKTVSAE